MIEKDAHHLWSATKDEDGNINLSRSRLEKERFADVDINMKKKMTRAATIVWGLFGASLVDDQVLSSDVPLSIANNFNKAASKLSYKDAPRIYSWDELRVAFGNDVIADIRKNISDGMKYRMASKYLGVPFVIAVDIVNELNNVDKHDVKNVISHVKKGYKSVAIDKFGKIAQKVIQVLDKSTEVGHKIAIDNSAEKYWENYYGPYGKELVREIKKRVRADLANEWLRKNGVDEAAAKYWSEYYGAYGQQWVNIVPKKISPVNNK